MVAPYTPTPSALLLYAERIGQAMDEYKFDDALLCLCKMYVASDQFFNEGIITPEIHKETKDFYFKMLSLIIDYQLNF